MAFRADNVAVSCITSGAARTRLFQRMTKEHIDYMLTRIPRGQFEKVKEIASWWRGEFLKGTFARPLPSSIGAADGPPPIS